MIQLTAPSERATRSVLGRSSALVKLGVCGAWLVGLVATLDPRPPIVLTAVAVVSCLLLGRVGPHELARSLAPLWSAAVVIGALNAAFNGHNADPGAVQVAQLGPLRLTEPGVRDGLAVGLRVLAIAATSVAFARTTDPTGLADSLVQQARVPDRFAYGALAAYQAVPGLGLDLLTLRQARRIRGLRASWHPRVLVALLALAVRRADRLALSMDARGFGLGARSYYRQLRWNAADAVVGVGGVAALGLALLVTRL